MKTLLVLLAVTALSSQALATTDDPQPIDKAEPRVRQAQYRQNAIYKIEVPRLAQTRVQFGEFEHGKVKVSLAQKNWHYDYSGGGTVVFWFTEGATPTYAPVTTYLDDGSTRLYTFELRPAQDPESTMMQVASAEGMPPVEKQSDSSGYAIVDFTYGTADNALKAKRAAEQKQQQQTERRARQAAFAATAPPVVHASMAVQDRKKCDFWWRGSGALLPLASCDLGNRTLFVWPGQLSVPGVFVVASDGSEQAATCSPRVEQPGAVECDRAAPRWVLRSGKKLATELWNSGYDPLYESPAPANQRIVRR